jgi:SNF2 family DNA or RNA helicase
MLKVEKLEKGTYFEDAYKVSFKYDPLTVNKIKELAQRRYLPEDRAWEIPVHELPNLAEKVGINNISADDSITGALKTKEIENKREATAQRLKGIKPIKEFDFKTEPLPHQIEAFNYGLEKDKLLIGDEQGLGKTKESIDITVARKSELIKCLIVCGVNSVKYNWEKEISIHSRESSVMIDGKTMDARVNQILNWYNGEEYYGIINIESLRNEKIQDALYVGIKDGFIGAIIVDEIHKAKNGRSQQGKALRFLRAPVRIGLSGTPMNKAEDLWNILTWLDVEKRSFYSFRNTYCIMGGYGNYKVIGHKNLESLNAELNNVMLRRKKEEVLDLPPKVYSTEFVELTKQQQILYRDIKNGIIAELEDIIASVNPLSCTLRLRQLTGGLFTEDNPKLDRVKDMLDEEIIPNGNKAIIFSQWEQITELYKEALKEYNPIYITGKVSPEERQKLVDKFQSDPTCKIAIGTIGAMGTGLTLNKASYVFFVDKMWNSGDNIQAEDRAHRIGTTGTVNIISLVAKGSVDEGVEEYLIENKDLFDRVVDGKGSTKDIRTIINKLLKLDK